MPSSSPEGRDEEAVRRFIENFAVLMAESGMQRMAARVFLAVLCTDGGRLTAGELAETLQVSPAAISGALRYLGQVGLVVREREPGSRRDHYRVYDDLWYEAALQRDSMLAQWEEGFNSGVDAVGPDTPAGRRLAESRDFFAFFRKEIPALIERWRARQAERTG